MPGISKIGKYLIRRELGKGAMGVVYEGFDPVIERTVAIKTILPQQLNSAEAADVLARFKREAQAAGRLNHPGIVAVYDYGEVVAEDDHTLVAEDDHTLVVSSGSTVAAGAKVAFIAMEFVKGRELRDFFEADERFPLREVQRLMGEILAALAHAHSHGVVHRDMKPANLIVLDNGSVKIADFGIARVEKSELTQAGTIMGTPAYMSPEQFMGQTVDGRSDIFSCGVILYQFLTGEKPFTGNTTTIMYKVLREEPLAPSMLNVALPAGMDAVVKKAMAKSPDDRYQSAAAFADAIDRAVATPVAQTGSAGEQTIVGAAARAASDDRAAAQMTAAASGVAQAAPPPRRSMGMVIAGVAAVVAVAAGYLLAPGGRGNSAGATPGPGTSHAKAADPVAAATPVAAVASAPAVAPLAAVAPLPAAAPAAGQSLAPVLPATVATPAAAPADPVLEPGNTIVSALGLVNPTDPRFNGDAGAAQAEARADAKRQLVEKVLALYVDGGSLNKNYALIQEKLLSQSGSFIKTVLTSWTVSAIDKSTGEEIYLNTVMPKGQSWASEDQALGDIGRLMGDEFSRSFFLQHFSFGVHRTVLNISGLPNASVAQLLLRELRGVRRVVDAQLVDPGGIYLLQLPQGGSADLVQDAVIRPLNAKLGQNCLALGSSNDREVNVSFASACADAATRARLENMPPAGLLNAPDARGKPLLKDSPVKTMV